MVRSIKHLRLLSICEGVYVARSGGAAFKRGAAACNSLYPKQSAAALKKEKCFFMTADEAQVKSCSIMPLQFKTFCRNFTLGLKPAISDFSNRPIIVSSNHSVF